MGEEQMKVYLLDLESSEMFSTYGGLDALIYSNCYIRSEAKLSSRHSSLVTLAVL